MKTFRMKTLFAILILTLLIAQTFAKKVPPLKGRINDYANLLTNSDKRVLEQYLADVERSTSSQLVLLTVKSLDGDNLESFSMRVAEKWKIGQKGLDNGAILLVAKSEHKIRLEVGYGLEALLTDAKSSYIIRNAIVPEFKRGDFAMGIKKGLMAAGGIVTGEFEITPEELAQFNRERTRSNSKSGFPFGLIVFVIIILLSGGRRGRHSGGGLFTGMLLGSLLGGGGRSSGGFSDFGGFGGGGGGFGGGGASGGW